jgi:hypothetical protein
MWADEQPIEVCEAEDGHAAVEQFKQFTSPVIGKSEGLELCDIRLQR